MGSGIFVLVRCAYGLLRLTTSFQVGAGRRPQVAGSYPRPAQIDGDVVSMTEAGYPKLQRLGEEAKSGPAGCDEALVPQASQLQDIAVSPSLTMESRRSLCPFLRPPRPLALSLCVSLSLSIEATTGPLGPRAGFQRRAKLRASLEARSGSVLYTQEYTVRYCPLPRRTDLRYLGSTWSSRPGPRIPLVTAPVPGAPGRPPIDLYPGAM